MLALPTSDFLPPAGTPPEIEHNIKLDILCDWIEASVLFDGENLSTTDVVDILMGENLYDNSDSALEIVRLAWNELKRRSGWIGDRSPFFFIRQTVRTKDSWQEVPAHSFCLLLSMPLCYDAWRTAGYNEQGQLFESLTKASIEAQFSGWKVYQTGWSRSNAVKLPELVDEIANRLGEIKGDIEPWGNPMGNDAGLDLLCYRPFPDNRVGIPVYLVQCASGKHWNDKLHEPDIKVWTKIILFAATPRKAFAIPFALLDNEFANQCNKVDGMLLDRYRLLAAAKHNAEWVPDLLKGEIIKWITPRLETLQRYS